MRTRSWLKALLPRPGRKRLLSEAPPEVLFVFICPTDASRARCKGCIGEGIIADMALAGVASLKQQVVRTGARGIGWLCASIPDRDMLPYVGIVGKA